MQVLVTLLTCMIAHQTLGGHLKYWFSCVSSSLDPNLHLIALQTLVGHKITCLDPSWIMQVLVTHESLVGAFRVMVIMCF